MSRRKRVPGAVAAPRTRQRCGVCTHHERRCPLDFARAKVMAMGRGRPTQGRPVGGDVGGDARASADLTASPNCCLGISGTWAGSAPAPAWGSGTCAGSAEPAWGQHRHLGGVSGTCVGSAPAPVRGQQNLGGVSGTWAGSAPRGLVVGGPRRGPDVVFAARTRQTLRTRRVACLHLSKNS